jgi:hypothetical protein
MNNDKLLEIALSKLGMTKQQLEEQFNADNKKRKMKPKKDKTQPPKKLKKIKLGKRKALQQLKNKKLTELDDIDKMMNELLNEKTDNRKLILKSNREQKKLYNYLKEISPENLPKIIKINNFGNIANAYSIASTSETEHDVDIFFNNNNEVIRQAMKDELKTIGSYKIVFILHVMFKKIVYKNSTDVFDENIKSVEQATQEIHHFIRTADREHATIILSQLSVNKAINKTHSDFNAEIDRFIHNGSGWSLSKIVELQLITIKYKPFKGNSYIPLPQWIMNTQACINIKNKDNCCFKWSILSALHPAEEHTDRLINYKPYENTLDFSSLEYPVSIEQITKFEKLNENIIINVFQISENKKEIEPLRIKSFDTQQPIDENKTLINLLLFSEKNKSHYVWIKNFSRLCNHLTGHEHKKYWCFNCLQSFSTEEILNEHRELKCINHHSAKLELPKKKDAFVQFKNHKKSIKAPFVIYADFESLTVPTEENNAYQNHVGCSYGYKIISNYEEYTRPYKTYRGENAVLNFLESINNDAEEIFKLLKKNIPLIMTKENEEDFENAINCNICGKELNEDRVRDHDHLTGKYRGACHNKCNINYNLKNYRIPVVFHNLRGYDSHLIMSEIGKVTKQLTVIANTPEKYISFSTDKFNFIDSFQFMASSLEELIENLVKAKDNKLFKHTINEFNNNENMNLLLQKGVYPYDYVNDFSIFDEKELPSKDNFYSILNNEEINDEDYKQAQDVFNKFNCKNIGDYHDLYLKTDVCLLADVFENFRNICIKTYDLDPANYLTAPSLSWDAMLKLTNIKLETFNDKQVDMLLFVENGIRGGICMISKRYAQANNKYLSDEYLKEHGLKKMKKDDQTYIIYLDANNLYGWAMSQPLPTGNYKWVNANNFNEEKILKIEDDDLTGYIFEVDLEYPNELHDSHSDYPLAPEQIKGEYSPYIKKIIEENKIKSIQTEKLIPNLYNKKNYVVHYRNLKLYLQLGMKLTKIHRVLSFNQSKWLAPYIRKNTNMRKNAMNKFEKDFYKLMVNAIFGKTCENVRKRINLKLITDKNKAMRYSAKPNFKNMTIFNENLIAIDMYKTTVKFDRPIIIGFCILDLSKVLMYDFHYNTMRKMYNDNVKLLFTDTDSLCYEIKTNDLYDDLLKIKDKLDTSNFPKNNKLFSNDNMIEIGKFKSETTDKLITEFIGLRAKLYSFTVYNDNHDHKKAKGIKKATIIHDIKHEDYKRALFGTKSEDVLQHCEFNLIRSKLHKIQSITVNKISLSITDDKKYVLNDGISTRALGHYLNHK